VVLYRIVRWFVLVAIAWTVIASLPALARFLRMRAT
jgi:hypothetical protein